MKLRNKDTGEIVDFITIDLVDDNEIEFTYVRYDGDEKSVAYRTLKNFNNDWEDYVPKEPLIKDEKIRKAVRVWADVNEALLVIFDSSSCGFSASDAGRNLLSMISFDGFVFNCEDGKYYTIDELCGEDEE